MNEETSSASTEGGPEPVVDPIEGYRLLHEIGRGGMGVVHLGHDLRLNREVAVKLLGEGYQGNSVASARFVAEARITGQMEHPCIPPVHELGKLSDSRPFLAMKLVKGRTLHDLLKQRPAGEGEVPAAGALERGRLIAIFEQICQAVGYAHAHGVIHRDLKPLNVMVGAFGEVQVMDWGLAKVLTPEAPASAQEELGEIPPTRAMGPATQIDTPQDPSWDRTGVAYGSPPYMAPEQAGGEIRKLDARTDVFGLGAILCEILTGFPPFQGKDWNEIRLKAVRSELKEAFDRLELCRAEPDLLALCRRCLASHQEDRPADGGAVAQEVARIRQAAEDRARQAELERAEALVREAEQRKRRRVWLGLAASLLIGLLVSTGLGLWANHARNQAVAAEREAQRERKLAEERLQLALENTDRVTHLADSVETLGSGNASILEKVVSVNVENLDALVREAKSEARAGALNLSLAKNLNSLSKLRVVVGNSGGGMDAANRAVTVLESVRNQKPDDPHCQAALADALYQLGYATAIRGNTSRALEHYQKALSIRQELVQHRPGDLDLQGELAGSHYSVGNVLVAQGHFSRARKEYEQATEIRTRLLAARPQHAEWRSGLALARVKIDHVATELGDSPDMIARYQEAIEVHQQLAREQPNNVHWKLSLADLRFFLGHELHNAGRTDEAAAEFSSVRDIAVPQSLADPRQTEWMRLRVGAELSLFDIDDPQRRLGPQQQLQVIRSIIQACRERVEEDSGNTQWKSRLALLDQILGLTLLRNAATDQDRRAAETALRSALAVDRALAALDLENFDWVRNLASGHQALGQYFTAAGQKQAAQQEQLAAVESTLLQFCKRRTSEDPDDLFWRMQQARAHGLCAGVLAFNSGSTAKQIENYEAAVRLLQPLVAAQPKMISWRSELAADHWYLATLFSSQDQHDKAVEHSRAALEHYLALQRIDPDGPSRLADLDSAYDHLESHLRKAGRPNEANAARDARRAVRARVYIARVKQVLQPKSDSARRQSSLMMGQYYERQIAMQRDVFRYATTAFWMDAIHQQDRVPQRLLAAAEAAVDLAARISQAAQWARQFRQRPFFTVDQEIGRLLQTALATCRSAYGKDLNEDEAALVAALADAVKAVKVRRSGGESAQMQAEKLAQLLRQVKQLIAEVQQKLPLSDRAQELLAASDAVAAELTPEPGEIPDFKLIAAKSEHTAGATAMAAAPRGTVLATASDDKTVRIRDPQTAQATATLAALDSVADCLSFSSDGRMLAAGTADGRVEIFDVPNQKRTAEFRVQGKLVSSISFSADDKLLAVAAPAPGTSGVVHLWDVAQNRELPPIEGFGAPVYLVSFLASSPRSLMAVGLADKVPSAEVRVVDCDTRVLAREQKLGLKSIAQASAFAHSTKVSDPSTIAHGIALTSDGGKLAVVGTDWTVTVWNAQTGQQQHLLKLPDGQPVVWLSFAPGDSRLVAGGLTGKVAVWQTDTGKLLGSIDAGDGAARGLFLGDGTILATARGDVLPFPQPEELKIWRLPVQDGLKAASP